LKFRLFHANFDQLDDVLDEVGVAKVNVILADLGVASSQLDDPARGLSFQADGPLDMRLDPRLEQTAADIVNNASQTELADMLFQLGGEVLSRKIAREICRRRVDARIATTRQLVGIIGAALHVNPESRKSKIHPATRTFQALRIAVNHELESLDRLLELASCSLVAGGRFGVISFHSLEDRRAKQSFQAGSAAGAYQILTKKPIQASEQEAVDNPRSRSAKFRAVRKIG
jgi:16S rRNA (cytosine1402-N4)-methyltransferase